MHSDFYAEGRPEFPGKEKKEKTETMKQRRRLSQRIALMESIS